MFDLQRVYDCQILKHHQSRRATATSCGTSMGIYCLGLVLFPNILYRRPHYWVYHMALLWYPTFPVDSSHLEVPHYKNEIIFSKSRLIGVITPTVLMVCHGLSSCFCICLHWNSCSGLFTAGSSWLPPAPSPLALASPSLGCRISPEISR